jgi:hypothetical protein
VEFRFDSISDAEVARVRLDRIRSFRDLSATEAARLGVAVATKNAPLELTVHLEGRNPEANQVTARLIALDWEYWVDDRMILDGRLERALQFPPGEPVDVPILIGFNLYRFFDGDARAVLDTALSLAGYGTRSRDIVLRIRPTVETAIGPIRYPTPISIYLERTSAP